MTKKYVSVAQDITKVLDIYVKTGESGVQSAIAMEQLAKDEPHDAAIASASAIHTATSLIKRTPVIGGGISLLDLGNTFTDDAKTSLDKVTSVTGALSVVAAAAAVVTAPAWVPVVATALGLAALGLSAYGLIAGDDEQLSSAIDNMFTELGKLQDNIKYAFDNPELFKDLFDELSQLSDSLNNIVIEGTNENDRPLNGTSRNDVIYGKDGDDLILGGHGNDVIYGQGGNDDLYGGFEDDTLVGGVGRDALYGGEGSDILISGMSGGVDDNETDTLKGGAGFDTYIVGAGDVIEDDAANEGKVQFKGIDLSGTKEQIKDSDVYEDDDFSYKESGSSLLVTHLGSGDSITINHWDSDTKSALGIKLESDKIEVSVSSTSAVERSEKMDFQISLSRDLKEGESLTLTVMGKTLTFNAGTTRQNYTYIWQDNDKNQADREIDVTPTIDQYIDIARNINFSGSQAKDKVSIKGGTGTIFDDDEEPERHDPLALDTNKDGLISTSSLDESTTYFDITGDGLRERVGWIKSEDALLVYDKNQSGQIDGVNEVFGNSRENGFEELKRLADNNYDNKIDRRDELFNTLQVWNDFNQDAQVQENN